jgi:hypothetical protein
MLFYDRVERLQVVHNRGHGFSKRFTLQGYTNVRIHARSIQPRQGMEITMRPLLVLQESLGGHPTKLPVMKLAELRRRTQKFARTEKTGRDPIGGIRQLHKACCKQINLPPSKATQPHPSEGGLETPPPSKVTPPKSKSKCKYGVVAPGKLTQEKVLSQGRSHGISTSG